MIQHEGWLYWWDNDAGVYYRQDSEKEGVVEQIGSEAMASIIQGMDDDNA